MMNIRSILLVLLILFNCAARAQSVGASPQVIKAMTSQWTGERSADGRPKVSDQLLERLKAATLEQIWLYLGDRGYKNQFEGNWVILKPGELMIGRVLTAQFMPARPDLDSLVAAVGKSEGRSQKGRNNIWPIDLLTANDIYVADGFGKIKDGTLIGSSLGNAVYGKSGKGVVFNGSIRDMQELKDTKGFNAWVKGHDPSAIRDMIPVSINMPIRIGSVSVLPGDIVFANEYGVMFIPAQLVEGLVQVSEVVALRDEFERILLQEGKYNSGEIHGKWNDAIKGEFKTWFSKYSRPTLVKQEQIDTYIKKLP